jgi:hypothetical protein
MCLGGDLAKDFIGAGAAYSLAAKIRVVCKMDWRRIVAALAASASANSPFTHVSGWWGYFVFSISANVMFGSKWIATCHLHKFFAAAHRLGGGNVVRM